MKILFNKYFDFIGVQNKGLKIVTFILLIICPIIYVLNEIKFEGHQILDLIFFNNSRLHSFTGKGLLELYSILLLPTIIVGVFIKVIKWVKMEHNRNKYFDFIGIENEGYKRLFILSLFITPFIYGDFIDSNYFSGRFLKNFLDLDGEEWVLYFLFFLPLSLILNGVFVKIYSWVKDGFSK